MKLSILPQIIILSVLLLTSCAKDDLADFSIEDNISEEIIVEDIAEEPEEIPEEVIVDTNLEAVYNWLIEIQMNNGLLESVEGSNFVSLYDNALAALAFIAREDYEKAAAIFDFFDSRIDVELLEGDGGLGQFRDAAGIPFDNAPKRWLGDNAWLLIALNNYHAATGSQRYSRLSAELENWIRSLQDTDGGLWGGYNADGTRIHKITEGILDAFNAVPGYDSFHENILQFLADERWDNNVQALIADPSDDRYRFALDLHAWGFAMLEDFPINSLTDAYRFLNSQTANVCGELVKGYCFDEDKDAVWLEGTGQMIVAFNEAGQIDKSLEFLTEMEKMFVSTTPEIAGIPYATNNSGTAFGLSPLWDTADNQAAVSSGTWYLFAKLGFNPFTIEKNKTIPAAMKFWNSEV